MKYVFIVFFMLFPLQAYAGQLKVMNPFLPAFNCSMAEDDFTGTNGDPPSSFRWTMVETVSGDMEIQSNKLSFDETPSSQDQTSTAKSLFVFVGDFDIQIDFTVTTCDQPNASTQRANVLLVVNAGVTVHARMYRGSDNDTAAHYVILGSNAADAWTEDSGGASSSGKIRIKRVSGTITAYNWENSQWEWDGNTAGYTFTDTTTDDMYVWIRTKAEYDAISAPDNVHTDFDNFTVNSGTCKRP